MREVHVITFENAARCVVAYLLNWPLNFRWEWENMGQIKITFQDTDTLAHSAAIAGIIQAMTPKPEQTLLDRELEYPDDHDDDYIEDFGDDDIEWGYGNEGDEDAPF